MPATRETPEQFREVIDINLDGCYWMAQARGRVMQPGSAIINIASVAALASGGLPQAAYSASKAGLIGLTRDLAIQWTGRKGIRVTALAPGYFPSEMTEQFPDGYIGSQLPRLPAGRPQGSATRAWAGLERARELGLARSIGVSNFSTADLDAVIAAGTIPPAVNQVEFNPQHYRRALLDACGRHNVAVEAYSPLGTGRYVADPTVAKIAGQTGRTPAQVLLRWSLQRGLIVIAKSTHRARILQNAQIFDFALSADDMAELDALDQTGGTDRALEANWWS